MGAGAHGKLTWLPSEERARLTIVRSARVKQPREFLRRASTDRVSDRFAVETGDVAFEYMLNVLRLTDEFSEADFAARTGLAFGTIAGAIAVAQCKRLLQSAGTGRWRVTELGQRFLNDLQALFLPERTDGRQSGKTTAR